MVLSDLILANRFSILRATVCSGAVDGRLFNQEVVGSIQGAVKTPSHMTENLVTEIVSLVNFLDKKFGWLKVLAYVLFELWRGVSACHKFKSKKVLKVTDAQKSFFRVSKTETNFDIVASFENFRNPASIFSLLSPAPAPQAAQCSASRGTSFLLNDDNKWRSSSTFGLNSWTSDRMKFHLSFAKKVSLEGFHWTKFFVQGKDEWKVWTSRKE